MQKKYLHKKITIFENGTILAAGTLLIYYPLSINRGNRYD